MIVNKTEIVNKLKSFNWNKHDIDYVILFGSILQNIEYSKDIDLAIKFQNYNFEKYISILEELAKYLNIPEDKIDIVILNESDYIPCSLIIEIYSKGELIYCKNLEEYTRDILSIFNICIDFLIDRKKLRLIEIALKQFRWE